MIRVLLNRSDLFEGLCLETPNGGEAAFDPALLDPKAKAWLKETVDGSMALLWLEMKDLRGRMEHLRGEFQRLGWL